MMRSHGAAALVSGSLLHLALYAARVHRTHELTFGFLIWNLFLALVPFVAAHASAAAAEQERMASAWVLALVWLVFLPNAPYVITDFVHLRPRMGAPLWYDAALLGSAALTGLVAGGLSLRAMHAWVGARYGAWAGRALIGASTLAAGIGIYLGRFERHNSWDLVLRPRAVFGDVVALLRDPSPRAIVVTAVFGAILIVSYFAVGGTLTARKSSR